MKVTHINMTKREREILWCLKLGFSDKRNRKLFTHKSTHCEPTFAKFMS